MSIALPQARAAEARGEVPVGAALARCGVVIASAATGTREDSDPTAHAEMIAIRSVAKREGARLTESTST